jgi:hypothetical protein
MKPKLKPPGTKLLKLECLLLSTSAGKFNLRRCTAVREALSDRDATDTFFAPDENCIQDFSKWAGPFPDCLLIVYPDTLAASSALAGTCSSPYASSS